MQATQTSWHTVVAVRVPRDSAGDLTSAATRRLATRDVVDDADVTAVRGIEPALAATVVTLAATVTTDSDVDADHLRRKLEAAPGCQRVDRVDPG
jgi:hypothetical protein